MNRLKYEQIDKTIQDGYALLLEDKQLEGCDKWLEVWEDIKFLMAETRSKDVYEIDKKFDWTQSISNYVQDLEAELHNAGIDDKSFHQKRIDYCRELLQYCGGHEPITENTRRAIAETYADLGDYETCDRLFEEWLDDDPAWGWGYIGWSDGYYLLSTRKKQYEKAENILLGALGQHDLRDRVDVLSRIVELYSQMKNTGKAQEYKRLLLEERRNLPESNPRHIQPPAKSEKVGRNDPCPCGSGKKYKKCCGANQ